MTGIQSTPSRNPNRIGIPVIRQTPGNVKIAALLNLIEYRMTQLRMDPVLQGMMRYALGCIQFRVNQKIRLSKIIYVCSLTRERITSVSASCGLR